MSSEFKKDMLDALQSVSKTLVPPITLLNLYIRTGAFDPQIKKMMDITTAREWFALCKSYAARDQDNSLLERLMMKIKERISQTFVQDQEVQIFKVEVMEEAIRYSASNNVSFLKKLNIPESVHEAVEELPRYTPNIDLWKSIIKFINALTLKPGAMQKQLLELQSLLVLQLNNFNRSELIDEDEYLKKVEALDNAKSLAKNTSLPQEERMKHLTEAQKITKELPPLDTLYQQCTEIKDLAKYAAHCLKWIVSTKASPNDEEIFTAEGAIISSGAWDVLANFYNDLFCHFNKS
jgi:regulator of sirC expression with transglutaminase-like and TPR domain